MSQSRAPEPQREFIAYLIEDQNLTPSLITACEWFSRFIDIKYAASWSDLIIPTVILQKGEKERFPRQVSTSAHIPATTKAPTPENFAIVDHVLTAIEQCLQKKRDFALTDAEDELEDHKLVLECDDMRAGLHQLTFASIGWLSMRFIPLHSRSCC